MLHRFELEGNGSVSCGIHAVEDSRDVVASVDAGHQQEADFIDEIGLEKSSVDMAAAFEQQRADAEVLAEASYSPSPVTASRASPSIFPSTEESMWQMIYGFIEFLPYRTVYPPSMARA